FLDSRLAQASRHIFNGTFLVRFLLIGSGRMFRGEPCGSTRGQVLEVISPRVSFDPVDRGVRALVALRSWISWMFLAELRRQALVFRGLGLPLLRHLGMRGVHPA